MGAWNVGDVAICQMCGKGIVFVGPYWDHPGEIKPRHPATPVGEQGVPPAHWTSELDPRELAQVYHAIAYARDYADAGAPGHGQFLLIAKLAQMLDDREPHEDGGGE